MMSPPAERLLDLRGVYCPENIVRLQAAMDGIAAGEGLELWVDEGDPVRNISQGLKEDGHRIISAERREGYFVLQITKGA